MIPLKKDIAERKLMISFNHLGISVSTTWVQLQPLKVLFKKTYQPKAEKPKELPSNLCRIADGVEGHEVLLLQVSDTQIFGGSCKVWWLARYHGF